MTVGIVAFSIPSTVSWVGFSFLSRPAGDVFAGFFSYLRNSAYINGTHSQLTVSTAVQCRKFILVLSVVLLSWNPQYWITATHIVRRYPW